MTDPSDRLAAGWTDVSVPLRDSVPIFAGDPAFGLERVFSIAGGQIANVSRLHMGVHTGTHLDAPVHFIDGAPASESILLDAGMGPAWVVDATHLDGTAVEERDLVVLDLPADAERLLFKTRNSALWAEPEFSTSFIGLGGAAAAVLAAGGVRLVGIDYLSIAPYGDAISTHQALLGAGVVILEGLNLREVEPGPVELLCLPIRLVGSDGVPARVLVRPLGRGADAGR